MSTSESTRDTKNDATEPMTDRSWPAALACSRPARKASITARYRSIEKISVTFTLMPLARVAVIAGRPSTVAGILIITFGRPTVSHSRTAVVSVAPVSRESRGSTSMDTRPSTAALAS